jgi:hypothetical protein
MLHMTAAPVPNSLTSSTASTDPDGSIAAHVVGLQQNLTVPSRDRAGHVDLWYETRFEGLTPAWHDVFERLALMAIAGRRARVAAITLCPVGPHRGYIVARGVPATLGIPEPAELEPVDRLIRALVHEVSDGLRSPGTTRSPGRRSGRLRMLQAFGILFGA